jgi:hypothetical protein
MRQDIHSRRAFHFCIAFVPQPEGPDSLALARERQEYELRTKKLKLKFAFNERELAQHDAEVS